MQILQVVVGANGFSMSDIPGWLQNMNPKDMTEFVVSLGAIITAIVTVFRYLSVSPLEELYVEGIGKTVLQIVYILRRMLRWGVLTFFWLTTFYYIVNAACIWLKFEKRAEGAAVILIFIGLIIYIKRDLKIDVKTMIKLILVVLVEVPTIYTLAILNYAIAKYVVSTMGQSDITSKMFVELIIKMSIVVGIDALVGMILDMILYSRIVKGIVGRSARIALRIADESNSTKYELLYIYEKLGDNLVCGKEEGYNCNTCIKLIPMTELTEGGKDKYTLLRLSNKHSKWEEIKAEFASDGSGGTEQKNETRKRSTRKGKRNNDKRTK